MSLSQIVSVGLRLIDTNGGHRTYFDGTDFEFVEGSRKVRLATPANGDKSIAYHRVDAGFDDAAWDHSTYIHPENLGDSGFAVVQIQHAASNLIYDPATGGGRTLIDGILNGTWLTAAGMALETDTVGRYRYMKFNFTTEGGTKNASLSEVAFTEDLRLKLPSTGRIIIEVDGQKTLGHRLDIVAGDSIDLDVVFKTATGLRDLTGATAHFALHRSAASAQGTTLLVIPAVAMTIDTNPLTGEASIALAGTNTQRLRGSYIAEVILVDGAVRVARQFAVHVAQAVAHSGISLP